MNIREFSRLVASTRTHRRFAQGRRVDTEFLQQLVECARLAGSARNLQPLKYMICNDLQNNERIFPHLGWAGYLREWRGPVEGERPAAYILCLLDTRISDDGDFDLGIASQNILLAAGTKGIVGCRIASLSPRLSDCLDLADHLQLKLVIALGYPGEDVIMTEVKNNDVKYRHGSNHFHYVPKRSLGEILLPLQFK